MNLLAYVIPAIREIRAPLVGGCLWLFAVWLFAADRVPEASEIAPDSAWAPLHRVADAIGSAGNVVIVSATAILVGSLIGEFVHWGLAQARLQPDRLTDLSEAVPETKYLVDRALQLFAEAELRFHIALPSVAVTLAFLGRRAWLAALLAAAAVVVMSWHGLVLARRARVRSQIAEVRARKRADELTAEERRKKEAHVDADIVRRTGRWTGAEGYALRLSNTGNARARGVDVDASLALVGGMFPLEELPAGEEVEVPFAASLDSRDVEVAIRWTDGSGYHEYVKALRL